jgi:hypothetical protein
VKPLLDSPAFNIVIFALLLSLPWELGQMWLYAGSAQMSHLEGIRICMAATAGDAVIMLIAFGVVALAARSPDWVRAPTMRQTSGFVAFGLIVTSAVEIMATHSDGLFSWRYAPAMPVTPLFGVGLVPLLMWVVVPLLVLWFACRQIAGSMTIPGAAERHRASPQA